jgi:hypothetical protein
MSGNSARRRMTKFMPADFRLIEARQPPLKDQYDEWLARVICYAFSVPASAFVSQVNRATSETLRLQATQEGLVPLKAWIKSALDHVIQVCLGEPDLEFVWVGDDAVDPLQQAQTLNILVGAGIKTIAEARADLGLAAEAKLAAEGEAKPALGKHNPYHDPLGLFTDAAHAVEPGASGAKPPKGLQVAANDDEKTKADAGGPGPKRDGETVGDRSGSDISYISSDRSAFHNALRDEQYLALTTVGNKCVKELGLWLGSLLAIIDIMCRNPLGQLSAIEIKTGETDYTPNQKLVYPHIMLGGIVATDPKAAEIGISPGQPLQPMGFFLVYAAEPGAPLRTFFFPPLR